MNRLVKIFNNPMHRFWKKYIIIDRCDEAEIFDLLSNDKKYNSDYRSYLIIPRKLFNKLKERG